MKNRCAPFAPIPALAVAVLAAAVFTVVAVHEARACHMPESVRAQADHLTVEQLTLMAHGEAAHQLIPYSLAQATACTGGMADIFPCSNVDLLAFLPLTSIGGGSGNDMWGWVDPVTSTEYALIGRTNGTAFVDVSNPEAPVYVGNLPTHASSSTWRDIKVDQDHAFIVADYAGAHGLQVFDLTQLRNVTNPPVTFGETAHYGQFNRAHNIAINPDSGFAYAVGSDTCSGGLHVVNIQNPAAPSFAGCFSADGYTHDAQCVNYSGPDPDHQGKEICFNANEDTLTIVDVTNKANMIQLSRTGYSGSAYTHQGWLTDDQRFFLHDDELDEQSFGHNTKTYTWNVENLDAPVLAGTFLAAGSAIDHNQYVKGSYTFQANYRRGLRILHLDNPATGAMTEVGFLDTYPEADGASFNGAWSVYPFLPSGTILLSDINRGLFMARFTPPTGCSDGDGDGYGDPGSPDCTFPGLDCDDSNPAVNPGAAEVPGNGIDDDCNPTTPTGCGQQQLAAIGTPPDPALAAGAAWLPVLLAGGLAARTVRRRGRRS